WVASNGTAELVAYAGDGTRLGEVAVPEGASGAGAAPTGLVFNTTSDFVIGSGRRSGPATLITASEDGTISAWNPDVNATQAVLVVDNSEDGSVYKGVTIAQMHGSSFVYAANFHNGTVDVFDADFNPVTLSSSAFQDRRIPANYAPFNVQNVGNRIFVTYAQQDDMKHDDVPGPGHGFVDVFTSNGKLISRFAARGSLNSPWAVLPVRPRLSGTNTTVLIGNFGDGFISAFTGRLNTVQGTLFQGTKTTIEPVATIGGQSLQIDGLWGMAIRNASDQPVRPSIVFASGPNDEQNALVGFLVPTRMGFLR
ncbi:MAG: TIGR03118 family protein, partial [Bacillota bacterium]